MTQPTPRARSVDEPRPRTPKIALRPRSHAAVLPEQPEPGRLSSAVRRIVRRLLRVPA